MTHIPPGGAATINGVLYQMLWTLLQAAKIQIESVSKSEDGALEAAVLLVEPKNGGDLRVTQLRKTVVMQVKSKADHGAWSLRQIVESVIPDLYLGCTTDMESHCFQFVTEGHRGDWKKVDEFFKSLGQRRVNYEDVVASLTEDELEFRRQPSTNDTFWPEVVSERNLFEKILEVISAAQKRRNFQPEEKSTTARKLWHILGNLDFQWDQKSEVLTERIDAFLLDVIDLDTEVERTRQSMIADLLDQCRSGASTIVPSTFFDRHNITTIPFSAQTEIKARATAGIQEALQFCHYDAAIDVRVDAAEKLLQDWPFRVPMLAISGESGMGKSWRLFAIANCAKDHEILPMYFESPESIASLLQSVEDSFCRIRNLDRGPSLERLCARRRRLLLANGKPWLLLCIDNIQDPEVARQLVRQPWERWEVQVVFGCHPKIAETIELEARERCRVEQVAPFSVRQVQQFLERRIGGAWADIPPDVLAMLRQPLLAEIFCRSVVRTVPEPRNEYELFDLFWNRISSNGFDLDSAVLELLTERILGGSPYPWTPRDLIECRVDAVTLSRLERTGWIRRGTNSRYEFSNDRLLNWAVARVLVSWLRDRKTVVAAGCNSELRVKLGRMD